MANTRQVPITFDSLKVVADATYMPTLLTRENLPDEMFDPAGANRARSDGGDVRLYENDDQTNELAREIVSFEHDSVLGAGDAQVEIWVSGSGWTNSSVSDTTIYGEYGDGTLTDYAVTDTYGRNAVYHSDYDSVYHGNDLVDSTGNGNTLTANAGATSGNSGGKIGETFALDDASSQYFNATTSLATPEITLQGWFNPDADTGIGQGIISLGDSDSTDRARLTFQDNVAGDPLRASLRRGGEQSFGDTTIAPSISTWSMGHGTYTTDVFSSVFLNGGNKQSGSTIVSVTQTLDELLIGTWDNVTGQGRIQFFSGNIEEARSRQSILSDSWIETEYNNQNDPATFATAGTPVAVGAITGTLDVTLDDVSSTSTTEIDISAFLDTTLGPVLLTGLADVEISSALDVLLDSITLNSTAEIPIDSNLDTLLDDVTLASSGEIDISGALNVTLDDVALSSLADIDIVGSLDVALAAVVLDSTGVTTDLVSGTLDATLDDVTLASSVEVAIVGALDITLGDVTLLSSAELPITSNLSVTLEDVNLDGTAQIAVSGTLDIILDALDLESLGTTAAGVSGTLTVTLDNVILDAIAGDVAILTNFKVILTTQLIAGNLTTNEVEAILTTKRISSILN